MSRLPFIAVREASARVRRTGVGCLIGIGLSIFAVSCSPARARPPVPKIASGGAVSERVNEPPKPAFDLQRAKNREANGLTKHVVDAGSWQAEVLAISPPAVQKERVGWSVSIDIGTQSKVQCFLHETMIDPGQTLGRILNRLSSGRLRSERVAITELKVIRDTPVLFGEGLYTMAAPGGRVAGLLKVAVQAHETHPLMCLHDELGYRQSFASVLESLASSLHGLPEPAEAQYVEISRLNLGDALVGFSVARMKPVAAGGSAWLEQSVQAVPQSATELLITDVAHLQRLDVAGTVIGGTWNKVEGGELASTVTLSRKSTGKYAYKGTIQSKVVAGEFDVKSKEGLSSMVSSARLLAGAMKKKKPFELTVEVYDPSLDPTKAVQQRYEGDGSGDVAASIQDQTIVEKLSPDGYLESWEFTVNGAKLGSRRVFTRGSH